jgi:hypothetical protein
VGGLIGGLIGYVLGGIVATIVIVIGGVAWWTLATFAAAGIVAALAWRWLSGRRSGDRGDDGGDD